MIESSNEEGPRIIPMEQGLQDAVKILGAQLVELHVVWQQYRDLYADAGAIDVLNRTAGLFFKIIQDQLWDSILLGVCRMLDPAEQGRGKGQRINLTLYSLPALITETAISEAVKKACDDASKLAEFAKVHRDKRIAHQDHGYATNPALFEMNGISRKDVERTLEALRAVMRLVQAHYNDADVRYENPVLHSGAAKLISQLKQLERLREKAMEASRSP